jgi:uncharacterized protein (UPF0335 family)
VDRESLAMDRLYFYVRRMDYVVGTLKKVLNMAEERFANQLGKSTDTKMINYFLRARKKDNTSGMNNYNEISNCTKEPEDVDDKDDEISEEEDNSNNTDSDKDTISNNSDNEDYCGYMLEKSRKQRSKALRTIVAIAGCMVSLHPQIMADCKNIMMGNTKLQ